MWGKRCELFLARQVGRVRQRSLDMHRLERWVRAQDLCARRALGERVENDGDRHTRTLRAQLPAADISPCGQVLGPVNLRPVSLRPSPSDVPLRDAGLVCASNSISRQSGTSQSTPTSEEVGDLRGAAVACVTCAVSIHADLRRGRRRGAAPSRPPYRRNGFNPRRRTPQRCADLPPASRRPLSVPWGTCRRGCRGGLPLVQRCLLVRYRGGDQGAAERARADAPPRRVGRHADASASTSHAR